MREDVDTGEQTDVAIDGDIVAQEEECTIAVMPLSLANKIAAGEVVQRPASAVKELIENAIDAGADDISIVLQDAGSTLIQITDNGSGMSAENAARAVKRHATSKISCVEDLETIATLGFRGEALASIASVSHFELRTGRSEVAPAIRLKYEGGEEKGSEPSPPMKGTMVSVRNLYFNVPARRNFLKRPQTELKHILDAVQVLALSNPGVAFQLDSDGNELLSLPAERRGDDLENMAARAEVLLPVGNSSAFIRVEESTSYLRVRGILGIPDAARRTRGLQFLFVNGRWVKHRYIEHAVHAAYEYLLPEGSFPFFALFLDIDPRHVDVNVHPTKSEVKFDDERGVYGMVRAVVGRALGTSLNTPDFSTSRPLGGLSLDLSAFSGSEDTAANGPRRSSPAPERSRTGPETLPWGERPSKGGLAASSFSGLSANLGEASRTLYEGVDQQATAVPAGSLGSGDLDRKGGLGEEGLLWQLHDTYILTQILSGLVIIDQQMAHERILFEQAEACLKDGFGLSQQLLFPRTIEFSASEYSLLQDLMPDLARLGFDIEPFGGNSVIVRGVPADITTGDEQSVLDEIVDQYRMFEKVEKLSGRENLARSVARRGAVRAGIKLSPREMRALIDQLFQCEMPYVSPEGRPTMIRLSGNELRERFERK